MLSRPVPLRSSLMHSDLDCYPGAVYGLAAAAIFDDDDLTRPGVYRAKSCFYAAGWTHHCYFFGDLQ